MRAEEGVSKSKENESEPGPSPEARELFMDIVHHPFDKLKARYKRLGLTRELGDKHRLALAYRGLIRVKELTDKQGNFTLLEPTESGWDSFKDSGKTSLRHGGLEHAYGINRAAEHFRRKGLQVSDDEWPLGGGMYADRAVFINGQPEGTIECETMKAGNADVQMMQNIRKALEAGFKWVCIVTMNEKGFRRAHTALQEFGFFGGKAQLKQVWELL